MDDDLCLFLNCHHAQFEQASPLEIRAYPTYGFLGRQERNHETLGRQGD